MVRTFTPTDLQSLFAAFVLLENGTSVCLVPISLIPHPLSFSPQLSALPPELTTKFSPFLGLYSSGSTGNPKLSWRRWAQLKSEARLNPEAAHWNWASPFAPCSFAGVQVALQAWASHGRMISISVNSHDAWKTLIDHNVHALSCTPTFLDLLLQSNPVPHDWNPAQITLGGEPLRQVSGNRFQKAFPKSRFTIIYASAEFGILLKTHRLDGWYELSSIEKRYPRWRVVNDELHLCQGGAWQSTGDLVELKGDVIRVIGRADAVANVAGSKVSLDEVSSAAEEVPGVRVALAFAEPNSITGQIVALRFTPEDGFTHREIQDRLEAHLRQRLPREAWPRRWEIGSINFGPNAKRVLKSG
jgi:long-chain acyl-CoA synthetase